MILDQGSWILDPNSRSRVAKPIRPKWMKRTEPNNADSNKFKNRTEPNRTEQRTIQTGSRTESHRTEPNRKHNTIRLNTRLSRREAGAGGIRSFNSQTPDTEPNRAEPNRTGLADSHLHRAIHPIQTGPGRFGGSVRTGRARDEVWKHCHPPKKRLKGDVLQPSNATADVYVLDLS